MYDLRDPNWVPPHLRPLEPELVPEPEPPASNVLPFARPERVFAPTGEPPHRDAYMGMVTWTVLAAALDVLFRNGITLTRKDENWEDVLHLREDLQKLGPEELYEQIRDELSEGARSVRVVEVGTPNCRLAPGKVTRIDKRGRPRRYPFREMLVGEQFLVPPGPDQPTWRSFYSHCTSKEGKGDKRFQCKRHPNGTFILERIR